LRIFVSSSNPYILLRKSSLLFAKNSILLSFRPLSSSYSLPFAEQQQLACPAHGEVGEQGNDIAN
jgi:hypothetical protein